MTRLPTSRHTLRQSGALWHWTYSRGIFFFSGVSHSRLSAIHKLLDARRDASECVAQMNMRRAA